MPYSVEELMEEWEVLEAAMESTSERLPEVEERIAEIVAEIESHSVHVKAA